MVATRKLSTSWAFWLAAALLGILSGYSFLGQQPVQAQFGNGPLADLQRQIRELQLSQAEQDDELDDLDLRVAILEEFAFGGGGGGGGGDLDLDLDGDGFSPNQGDCDDTNPTTNPGAVEIVGDSVDNDCDGRVDEID